MPSDSFRGHIFLTLIRNLLNYNYLANEELIIL